MTLKFQVPACLLIPGLFLLQACATRPAAEPEALQWLAGDHHIHSRYSVGYDREAEPPAPIIGGDAIYPIPFNNLMASHFGLAWVVATDHGGPNHSKVNFEQAYPELLLSREVLPDMVQFYGMELNTPGADHSTIMMPHTHDERDHLLEIESRFDTAETWPVDPARNDEGRMLEALRMMDAYASKPIVIANHPSRSATGLGEYGLVDPAELRNWNDTAPEVAIGMAGAPGHQAIRGGYFNFPTLGGFDQMTARLGGFWDSMLGEGRRWWITANSDSHVHYTEGRGDFWPGEYSKTYVYAARDYDGVMTALRDGRIFVTTGDLISELYVEAASADSVAGIGGELALRGPAEVTLTIRLRDPEGNNNNDENPAVNRVDLIVGDILGQAGNRDLDTNPTTRVLRRFSEGNWVRDGEMLSMSHTFTVTEPVYVRVRGTNTDQAEPEVDPRGEDPWQDLWFYSNPLFISIE